MRDRDQLNIRTGLALMESPHCWVEAYPREPTDEADAGGELQEGTAWGRRFMYWHPESGLFAVLNVYHYVAFDPDAADGAAQRWVQRQVELMVCSDYTDPGSTELYADYDFTDLPCEHERYAKALELAEQTSTACLPLRRKVWAEALPHLQAV